MNGLNYNQIMFSLWTLYIIVGGTLINSYEKYLPSWIPQIFRYGKLAHEGRNPLIKKIEVPKSWFRHYYVYSSVLFSLSLVLVLSVYFFNVSIPLIIIDILNFVGGTNRKVKVNGISVLLATLLLTLHGYRRSYETLYISVFSKNGRMNIMYYLLGYFHYAGIVVAILGEAPKFAESSMQEITVHWLDLTYIQLGAIVVFIWCSYHQHTAAIILANLRKGDKESDKYGMPHGDWFNYVSSPHNLAEILIHLALTIILWNNTTWPYILGWVLSNQEEAAVLTHRWYQEKFKDLPKERKALIPFIY